MSQNTTQLTKPKVQAHTFAGGRGILWDSKLTGFGVRAYASGKKAYVLSYRIGGQKRLLTLASVEVLTLDQARAKAIQELARVGSGEDPIVERRHRKKVETFGELSKRYVEQYAKPHKKTWEEDEHRLENHIPAAWKSIPAKSIKKDDVRDLHVALKATPYSANRLLALLSKVFNFGDISPNPVKGIQRYREVSRKRYARPAEIKALAEAIDVEPNIYVRAALWLYMLTGARRSELLSRRHDELDEGQGRLVLSDTKASEEQFIPLSAPALAIIMALPKVEKNPYLFPGRLKGKHLVNISKPWDAVKKRAGVTNLRLHDLRRTVGAWLSQGGVDLNTIKETLRHKNIATTLVYARLGEDPGREALQRHGDKIVAAAGRLRAVD